MDRSAARRKDWQEVRHVVVLARTPNLRDNLLVLGFEREIREQVVKLTVHRSEEARVARAKAGLERKFRCGLRCRLGVHTTLLMPSTAPAIPPVRVIVRLPYNRPHESFENPPRVSEDMQLKCSAPYSL